MLPIIEYEVVTTDNFAHIRSFILQFDPSMGVNETRQGFVEFAGEYSPNGWYVSYVNIIRVLNITSSRSSFRDNVATLQAEGGTTNTAYAITYVKDAMLSPDALHGRDGSQKIVILITDGRPSNSQGVNDDAMETLAEAAAQDLITTRGVLFVFVRIGNDYLPGWFTTVTPYIYQVASFGAMSELWSNQSGFLCF